jgi:hypothetical protein
MLRLLVIVVVCVAAVPASARKRGFFRSSPGESQSSLQRAHGRDEGGGASRGGSPILVRVRHGSGPAAASDHPAAPLRIMAPQPPQEPEPPPTRLWHCRDGIMVGGFCALN